jgi:outer membrane protein OmpA-like peptidoglycan-associated protein
VTRFYVVNYDNLDLTAYLADLEQSLAEGTEIARISIRAYSDTVGSSEDNLDRTQRFADAVKTWFVDRGIPADRIEAEGLGETDLAIATDDNVDQPLNRYVEIEIIR